MNARTRAMNHTQKPGRPWWLAFVLLCVLGAQTLGVVHSFAHANTQPAHADAGARAHATAQGLGHTQNVLEPLFDSHEDAGDCRLFDALGQQPGTVVAGPAYPPVLPPSMPRLRRLEGACVARWATLFDARGPPLSH